MRARVIQGLFSGGRSAVQPQAATMIQRQGGRTGFAVDPSVLRTTGPGIALPEALRVQLELALGAGFADVRIHVGPQAQSIGAVAFTAGSDLYFAPGRYQPETAEGRRLLGRLTHHVHILEMNGESYRLGQSRGRKATDTPCSNSRGLDPEGPRRPVSRQLSAERC